MIPAASGALRRVRALASPPDGIVERARWLFLVLAVASLALSVPPVVQATGALRFAVAGGAGGILVVSWSAGYRLERAPLVGDLLDALGIVGVGVASTPEAALSVTFATIWYRSLYGSTRRSLLRCALYVAATIGTVPLWDLLPGRAHGLPLGTAIDIAPFMFLTVIVGRQLGKNLLLRAEVATCDAALADAGARLLGATDAGAVRRVGWDALRQICRQVPGLRAVRVTGAPPALWVGAAAGRFSRSPSWLPLASLPSAAGEFHPVPAEALDAAAGETCRWAAIALPEATGSWLVVGAPGGVPPHVLVASRTLVNHVTLALRNIDVHDALTSRARTDPLTGLANRAAFAEEVAAALGGSDASPTSVLFIDLDDFKEVNDTFGHRAGDELLCEVAARLRAALRPTDRCARLGGDEFAALLVGADAGAAGAAADRVLERLARRVALGASNRPVDSSIGVATATSGVSAQELIRQADLAMYRAKAAGKGRVEIYDPGRDTGREQTAVRRRQVGPGVTGRGEGGDPGAAGKAVTRAPRGRR